MKAAQSLLAELREGDLRALSRLISLAENKDTSVVSSLSELHDRIGRAAVIGITGPPGAGKSTLTSAFVRFFREVKKTVGVVAVDPVSPFSGGALLGDRIRLVDHFNDPGVFIRSLSTKGKLGGLSLATREVVHIADAFGFDNVIVETVGVGQSEVDVRKIADVTIVVLVPEWGDAIQTLKAGLLEIGDIFVVNKSDREGADRLVVELKNMLQMAHKEKTPVLATSSQDEPSVRLLFKEVGGFLSRERELIETRRKAHLGETAAELLQDLVASEAREWVSRNATSVTNPYDFIQEFRKKHPPGSLFGK